MVGLLDAHGPSTQLHHICVEHVRVPQSYYRSMIIGGIQAKKAGHNVIEFVKMLCEWGKLIDGCKLQFVRHELDSRWKEAMTKWQNVFGPAKFVRASANPLFAVGELEEVDLGSYNNWDEVQRLAAPNLEFPVIEFELHPKFVLEQYRAMTYR